jgi:hypothetical protein
MEGQRVVFKMESPFVLTYENLFPCFFFLKRTTAVADDEVLKTSLVSVFFVVARLLCSPVVTYSVKTGLG